MRQDQISTLELSTDRLLGDYPDAPGPRLLKPAQQLRRLLPVRLGVVSTTLRDTLGQARAMQLIERFFPGELAGYGLGDSWAATLGDLLRLVVGAGWFGIHWEGIETLNEYYLNDWHEGDGDNPDLEHEALALLADFLKYIPVRYFNFGEEEWLNGVAEERPLLCLIRGLVDPTYEGNISSLRVEYGIWDNDLGPGFDPAAFSVPPDTDAPLCWLPDVVRFCARVTGNALLDTGVDAIWEQDWGAYQWDRPEDIETLKRLYPPALRAWGRVEAFLKWCEGDPDTIDQALHLLFLNGEYDYEKWKWQQ
jgi:hypothetical protein